MSPQPTSPSGSVRSPEAAHDTEEQQGEQPSSPSGADASHPPFEPLFTLLSNTTTNTTRHPRVHYIFSDDEPTIIPPSNSILVDLEATPPNPSSSTTAASDSEKPAPAWSVKAASSLSSDFAVTSANISGEGILKIEGVQREAVSSSRQLSKSKDKDSLHGSRDDEDREALVEEFRRRMGILKKVVEQGQKSISPLLQRDGYEEGSASGVKGDGNEDKDQDSTEGS